MPYSVQHKRNGDLWVTDEMGRQAALHWSRFHGLIVSVFDGGVVYLGHPDVTEWLKRNLSDG